MSAEDTSSQDTAHGIAQQLATLPKLLVGTDEMDQLVWKTASLGVRGIERVDACGVTVLREGLPTSIMPDIAPYADLEQLQYEAGDGPALAAVDRREPVLITSMVGEHRFGDYPRRATDRGVAASLSLPMIAEDEVLGSMTLYSAEPHDFGFGFDLALLVVDLATNAFSTMLKHAEQVVLAEQFRQALESRSVIDQAKGMVMLRHGCSAAEAFAFLRRRSQLDNIKLREIASAVVEEPAKWLM